MNKFMLFTLSAISFNSITAFAALTPTSVLDQIHYDGAKTYLRSLARENAHATEISDWEYIVAGISSGNAKWLKIVPLIASATDAGFAEDLATVLAQAIPKNVGGVMEVLNDSVPPVSVWSVCSMPLYVETFPQKNEYFVKAEQALYKLNTATSKQCLAQLIRTVGQAGPFRMVD